MSESQSTEDHMKAELQTAANKVLNKVRKGRGVEIARRIRSFQTTATTPYAAVVIVEEKDHAAVLETANQQLMAEADQLFGLMGQDDAWVDDVMPRLHAVIASTGCRLTLCVVVQDGMRVNTRPDRPVSNPSEKRYFFTRVPETATGTQ